MIWLGLEEVEWLVAWGVKYFMAYLQSESS